MPPEMSEEERATVLREWDTLSTKQREKMQGLGVKPEPAAAPTPTPTVPADPRASSPWYQRALESLVYGDKDPQTAMKERQEAWEKDPSWGGKSPREYLLPSADVRTGLQDILPLTAALATAPGPAKIPVAVQMARGPVWNLLQNIGPPAYRTILSWLTANMGAQAANVLDPEHTIDPTTHANWTAGGQALGEFGGNVVNRGATGLNRKIIEHFGDTPQGVTIRQTLESRGGEAALGTTTKSPFLESTSTFFEHAPGGRRLREIRTKGQQIVDDALQDYNRLFPGDEVSRRTSGMITQPAERSMLDLEKPLRPVLPGRRQTTLDAQARLRPHLPMGDPRDLVEVPREVQRRIPEAIEQQQALTDKAFQDVRKVVNEAPLDARPLRGALQTTTFPAGTQDPSLFHQFEDVKQTLAMLPDTITGEMGFAIQKKLLALVKESNEVVEEAALRAARNQPVAPQVAIVQRSLLPELGATLNQVNKMLEGRMVNLQPFKNEARTILAGYEQGTQVPQAMMQGPGGMGRVPTAEDPHILVARNLLDKPNFVQFDEAQQILSDLNALKRHPGMNIGNQPAEAGARLRDLMWGNAQKNLEGEIFKTANALDPAIDKALRNAQQLYEHGAGLYNSPLLMDLSKASLDDLLTKIVRNERPEDLRALRLVLGDNLFDRVGQMWLQRVEQASTDTVTKVVSPTKVQAHLHDLTKIAEDQLFPYGQARALKTQVDRTAAMEQALTTNEPLVYRDLKKQMTQVDTRQVGEIRLSQLAETHRDPVTGVIDFDATLKALQQLKSTDMAGELWPAAQLTQIEDSLRQASALKRSLTTHDPLVLKELQRQAGPHWDTAGELRLSTIFRDATDAHGNLNVGKALDGIHALRGEAEQVLYGNKLDPIKTALRKADAMEQVFKVLDKPEMISKYRQVINDPLAWQSVQRDVLSPGFTMMPRTPEMTGSAMIDGRALVNHVNEIRQNTKVAQALFPDQRILDELHHLGETAMALSRHGYEVPYAGRHYPFMVSFDPDGTPRLFGSKIAGAGAAVAGGMTQMNRGITALLTNPTIVRLLTQGMHTPVTSPQAARLFGALTGALTSEGLHLEMSEPPPLPKVGD